MTDPARADGAPAAAPHRFGFVLAGGTGTRLRPYTSVLPKPLIPLGTESILERVLRGFAAAGLEDVVISVGYLGHLVEAVIGDGASRGMRVEYTREESPLGTAGALALIPFDVADDDVVLVVNGDTLTSLDMGDLLDWFESSGADAAMVCVERAVTIDYGVVVAADDGTLVDIHEKPTTRNLLSTGINLLRGRALRRLPAGRVDMPDFLLGLVADGRTVLCRRTDDLWMDLGRVEDLEAAHDMIERGVL
ncbi:sugar phosphate nucleotidyltransferase [Cellulomonas algicola]|uniref:sugar phosphate nucleotidyltransferase n=1 Tax=Cellulomonas algicola TaxID=2071633 RepID=UPI00135C1373|nr:sugar phosphate nucleotidyltransferase [Cellulomonas algicola]